MRPVEGPFHENDRAQHFFASLDWGHEWTWLFLCVWMEKLMFPSSSVKCKHSLNVQNCAWCAVTRKLTLETRQDTNHTVDKHVFNMIIRKNEMQKLDFAISGVMNFWEDYHGFRHGAREAVGSFQWLLDDSYMCWIYLNEFAQNHKCCEIFDEH